MNRPIIISIISTCLPGTVEREICPIFSEEHIVYNPYFIAMGTVMRDFFNPEFVLVGTKSKYASIEMINFYKNCLGNHVIIRCMSISSAELTKIAYNTFITMKICFVNTLMEVAHKINSCNINDVVNSLCCAKERLISTKYLSPGMGDGGGCHPRDNIAMDYLAEKLDLSFSLFKALMDCRYRQTRWIASLVCRISDAKNLPICILGYAFKPGTNITTGSPALLLSKQIPYSHQIIDENVNEKDVFPFYPCVFVIGCKHPEYTKIKFPKFSVVIDPHRYIQDQKEVQVIRLGEHNEEE